MKYDGSQLKSLGAYLDHGLLGPSILAWKGSCDVDFKHMVDGEDLREASAIRGSMMLHFIIEIFDRDLAFAVCLQRLFVAMIKDELNQKEDILKKSPLIQSGDDMYWGKKKLSVSIATVSPVSQLIHLALNISNKGTPVETCALEDFKVNPDILAKRIMSQWASEFESIIRATQKVKPVS